MSIRLPEAFVPLAARSAVWRQAGWLSLDRRAGLRRGTLSRAEGLDPRALPALSPLARPAPLSYPALPGRVLSLTVLSGVIYAVTENETGEASLYVGKNGTWQAIALGAAHPGVRRTLLPFTFYNDPSDPLDTARNYPMVLIFPDGVFLRPDREDGKLYNTLQWPDSTLPYLGHGCVYLSRVFGIGGECVYASDHNCVTKWIFDTPESISASHAWVTASQSAAEKSAGDFTAIFPFGGKLLAFKEQLCLQIAGKANPFRMTELLPVGTSDARTVAQLGTYLFFADKRSVYRFDGDEVREIGAPLAATDLSGAFGAAAGGLYYLYVPSAARSYAYSPETGAWAELYPFTNAPTVAMAAIGEEACLFLDGNGLLYSTKEEGGRPFFAETAPIIPDLCAPARLLRVRLTAKIEQDSSLSLSCRLSDGRVIPLLTLTGEGRAERRSVPVPAPADTSASLIFEGEGRMQITAIDLVTAETATDGI